MKKLKKVLIILIVMAFCGAGLITVNATETDNTENDDIANIEVTENETAENEEDIEDVVTPSILYSSHLRNIGWEKEYSKKDGEVSGVEKQNTAIEAIKIKLNNVPDGARLTYQAHVQDIGWMNWVKEGQIAGTTGRAKKVEAIKIKLENVPGYTVKYSSYVQGIGWQAWAIDGEISGTTGQNKRVEAIKIMVVPNEVNGKVVIEKTSDPVYESTLNVSGWAMANAKDKFIETYIDGEKIENKITYSAKSVAPEIGYGGLENTPNPKYDLTIDVSNISDGEKTLKLKLLDKDGQELAVTEKKVNIEREKIQVKYQVYVQNIGWQSEVYSNNEKDIAGTSGRNLQVEALRIQLLGNIPENAKIKYQVHVQNIGWMDWQENGKEAGTIGRNLQVEGIRIKLENMDDYSVKYSAHVQDIGWQAWAIDGELAGTTGRNKQVEALQIQITPKENSAKIKLENVTDPIYDKTINASGWAMANIKDKTLETYIDDEKVESKITYSSKSVAPEIGYGGLENTPKPSFAINMDISNVTDGVKTLKIKMLDSAGQEITKVEKKVVIDKDTIRLKYEAHVQNIGWQSEVYSNNEKDIAGTIGRKLQVEALKINLLGNIPDNAKIKYQVHVQNVGWMDWQDNGKIAGTSGRNLQIEAVRIKLENMDDYSIEYRAHVKNIGWQNWAIDGEMAGTSGRNLRVEALQINVIPKTTRGKIQLSSSVDNTIFDENNVVVSGWAMSNAKNTKIEAYVDDEKIESSASYFTRTDIAEIGYGGIENTPKPGFNLNLNMNGISEGNKTLKVKLISETGEEIANTSKSIKVDRSSIGVKYETHLANGGWASKVRGDKQSNNTGDKIDGIKINLVGNLPEDAQILYKSHVQDKGWESNWGKNGELSGVTGQNRKIEALRIKLENVDDKYSVEYNAYVQGKGWQGWAYDGEIIGTTGQNKKIEALKIRIIDKVTETRVKMYMDNPNMDSGAAVKVIQKNTTVSGWAMTNQSNASIRILIDGKKVNTNISRVARQDVLDAIKGYGGQENNPLPGFSTTINFKNYSVGNHSISIQVLSSNGNVLCSTNRTLNVQPDFVFEEGIFGYSGLGVARHPQGNTLKYYKLGKGPNVMFATFAVHAWEDIFDRDGSALSKIAEEFKSLLVQNAPEDINNNWTIYVFPCVNIDGIYHGYTHNGPGRTTLYSSAPGNRGIDINRNWQTGSTYTTYTNARNYNGTAPYQAYEALSLRDFMLNHKSNGRQTVVVDLHGWLNETLGDNDIGSFYRAYYGLGGHISSYGNGYLINWARQNLGSNGIAAKTALIELPPAGSVEESAARGDTSKYYNATLDMLRTLQR